MPWFKVDDGFHGHPKVVELSLSAVGLWTIAGSWCAKYLTDGFVPAKTVTRLGGSKDEAGELVAADLWVSAAGGYEFKDWVDYQPLKADVQAERDAARERMKKVRAAKKGVKRSGELPANDEGTSEEVRIAPSQSQSHPSSSTKKNVAVRPDVKRVCELLADRIAGNGSKRPEIGKTWTEAARLLIDHDGRPLAEVVSLIEWCQADPFWKGNILSMPKFREKYDQLRLQRESKSGGKHDGPSWDKLRRLGDRK